MTDLQVFGTTIRKKRLESGLSQEKLAELCGLHRTYIGGIERGERNVSLLNILKIARALSTPPSERDYSKIGESGPGMPHIVVKNHRCRYILLLKTDFTKNGTITSELFECYT